MTASHLIELRAVSKQFLMGETEIHALSEVDLTVDEGETVALVGPSGSGKSTLLNLLAALDRPSKGLVKIEGKNLEQLSTNERAEFRNRSIGFIFQNFNLIPVLTTIENVLLPHQLAREPIPGAETRALKLLDRVGLAQQAHQSANRLSGGQMQRVAIARALINQPAIVLADEPTANLDHDTSEKVLELLRQLSQDSGNAVAIATHDPTVLGYCDRVVQMRDGRIVEQSRAGQG